MEYIKKARNTFIFLQIVNTNINNYDGYNYLNSVTKVTKTRFFQKQLWLWIKSILSFLKKKKIENNINLKGIYSNKTTYLLGLKIFKL